MEQIEDIVGHATIARGEEKHAQGAEAVLTQVLTMRVLQARDEVGDTIRSHISVLSPTTDFPQLQNLVDKAFTLAVEMTLQRSRFQVTFSCPASAFYQDRRSNQQARSHGHHTRSRVCQGRAQRLTCGLEPEPRRCGGDNTSIANVPRAICVYDSDAKVWVLEERKATRT
jgi:hypothetical protein